MSKKGEREMIENKTEIEEIKKKLKQEIGEVGEPYMKLSEVLKILLCYYQPGCSCIDPKPVTYYCVYGDCTIYRCSRCGGVIHRIRKSCNFPYSRH